jgi:hypothetical protein
MIKHTILPKIKNDKVALFIYLFGYIAIVGIIAYLAFNTPLLEH